MRLAPALTLLAALAACSSERLGGTGGPTGAGGQHLATGGSTGTGGYPHPSQIDVGKEGAGGFIDAGGEGGGTGDTVGPSPNDDGGGLPPDAATCATPNTPCSPQIRCCAPEAFCFYPGTPDGGLAPAGMCVYEVLL